MTKTPSPSFPWSVTDDEAPPRNRAPRQPAHGVVEITNDTLLEKIRATGLLAVTVDAVLDRSEDMEFAGGLDAYLATVKSLHGEAVFVSAATLDDDDFLCEADTDDGDDTQSAMRNLCDIQPAIGKFKSNIGAVGQFDLAAYMGPVGLTLSVTAAWYDEFLRLRDEALGILNAEVDSENERRAAEQEQRSQAVLRRLEALSGDKAFTTLPTQRAMQAYALEHIPELAALDERDLKNAIANVRAKIQARGLARR